MEADVGLNPGGKFPKRSWREGPAGRESTAEVRPRDDLEPDTGVLAEVAPAAIPCVLRDEQRHQFAGSAHFLVVEISEESLQKRESRRRARRADGQDSCDQQCDEQLRAQPPSTTARFSPSDDSSRG